MSANARKIEKDNVELPARARRDLLRTGITTAIVVGHVAEK